MPKTESGFSLLEIILAGALLLVFSVGATTAALAALDHARLGGEESTAVHYASSGLEILRSVRNRSFDALAPTAGSGTDIADGAWVLSGENDVFEKYVRTLSVRDVYRDGNGAITVDGGTIDPGTLLVTSKVEWDFTSVRHETVELSTYLTRWQDPL